MVVVACVFWPVHAFDFVNYDDADYVSANAHVQSGLTGQNLYWAFTTGHASNWHPLTWISHMLDWQLFSAHPSADHVVNMVIHALNTALLFAVLRRLTGAHWRSALVALLFGIHPLRAESVAWISERKDVLSTFFFLLTVGSYGIYAASLNAEAHSARISRRWYCAALACFALGLLSKPMLVTVPFLLLVLDYWPLQRFAPDRDGLRRVPRLVREKIPFAVMASISSIITFAVQRKGGAVSTSLSLWERVANALVSYARYVGKTVYPVDLSVLYPHPGHWPLWAVAGSATGLVVVCALAILNVRRVPYAAVGWFWFLGGLVPVIGFVQVGIQSMADRYTYIPGIGLLIAIVWGAAELMDLGPRFKPIAGGGAVLVSGFLAFLCAQQIQFWRNSEALFKHAIEVTSNNYLAYNNLGFYLSSKGELERAKENYKKSLEINPGYPDALNNLGYALAGEKKVMEAIPLYEAALRQSPNHPEIHNNLGNAFSELGRLDEAIAQYQITLRQEPDHADAHNNLGIALAMQGKLEDSISHFRAAIRAKPGYASAHSNLGNALAALHRIPEAVAEYQECLRLNPNDPQAHNNLGNALVEQGNLQQAIEQYRLSLGLNPANPEAHFNMAVALERQNNRAEASAHFQEVLRLNPANAEARKQLEALSKPGLELRSTNTP